MDFGRFRQDVLVTSSEWDDRYAEHEQMWSGRPNGTLLVELGALPPGTALDVGCGEGGDAIWLAAHGWRVTGLDVSAVALARARAAAQASGVDVEWVCAALTDHQPPAGGYDLVSVHYPALPRSAAGEAIDALLAAVAAGGTLLVVGHEHVDLEHARAHGFDPADYVHPPDVAARLRDGWLVEIDEQRPRVDPTPPEAGHVEDRVLRARRLVASHRD
jgi:SAM-dependent methyltransferase